MGNPKAKDLARLRACSLVLAYGHGLPTQNVKLSGGLSKDDGAGESDPDREFREQLHRAAEQTARSLGGGAALLGAGFTEIPAPDSARDKPVNAEPNFPENKLGSEEESLGQEVLSPIAQDHETLKGKDQLTAIAVGMAVASGFKRGI